MKILQTEHFKKWFEGIRDIRGQARLVARIRRFGLDNPGDVKSVGSGVYELRLHFSPGYRVYYIYQSESTAILLYGGIKDTQSRDIKRALKIAKDYQLENHESNKH